MLRTFSLSFVLMLTVGPTAHAAAWKPEQLRGLETHVIVEDAVQLRLICDPDRVFGADTSSLVITQAGAPIEGEVAIVFDAPDRAPLKVTASNGTVLRTTVEATTWTALTEGLMADTAFAMVTAQIKPIFAPTAGFAARCS